MIPLAAPQCWQWFLDTFGVYMQVKVKNIHQLLDTLSGTPQLARSAGGVTMFVTCSVGHKISKF
jgi:hypothetical protein